MATRRVTFTVLKPDGSAWASARVAFDLAPFSWSDTAEYALSPVVAVADENGDGHADLWANEDEAESSCSYKARLPDGSVTAAFSVPAGVGDISLVELLTLHSVPATPQYTTLAATIAAMWKGAYSGTTAYNLNDLCRATDGSTYICIQAGTGHEPSASPTYWALFASAGSAGAAGAPGPAGAEGAAGVDGANAWLAGAGAPGAGVGADGDWYIDTGTGDAYRKDSGAWGLEVNLKGPTGAAGADGADGAPGAPGAEGDSAYDVAVAEGFVGDEAAWLASLVGAPGTPGMPGADGADGADGAQGPQGIQGIQGPAGADGADGADGAPGVVAATAPIVYTALTQTVSADLATQAEAEAGIASDVLMTPLATAQAIAAQAGTGVTLSSDTPAALGVAAAGTGLEAARDDHVHAMPSASDVGADASGAAASVAGDLSTHEGLTTAAHGGIVADDDSRLSDAREPTAHASSHATAGDDALAPGDIGAEVAGAAASVAGDLSTHAGLTTAAHGGIIADTDARLTDARDPTAHASSHATAGDDALAPSDIGAEVAGAAASVAGDLSTHAGLTTAAHGGLISSAATRTANTVLAGPTTGVDAAPTFRALVAADLPAEAIAINDQSDSYTLALSDTSKLVRVNKATAATLTVPANASVAFAVGVVVSVEQLGAGQVTIAAAGGVTVNAADSALKLRVQYSVATLMKTATDTWVAFGDLTA